MKPLPYKRSRSCLHVLGADPEKDALVLAMGSSPAVALAEEDFPAVAITAGSDYAIGQIKHGDDTKLTLYAAPVAFVRMVLNLTMSNF